MKIRIKGDFIRYRLTKTEVQTLADEGLLEEATHFPGGIVFKYALEARPDTDTLGAGFDGGRLVMYLPAAEAATWPGDERVGYEGEVEYAPGQVLKLLLEKDFVCLDETVEDQSDNYPNPLAEYRTT